MPPLLLLLLLLVLPPAVPQPPDTNADALALLELKRGIVSDPSGLVASSWSPPEANRSSCPSGWFGVSCDPSGTSVVSLSLPGLSLTGDINLNVLAGLSSLQTLDLSRNNLSGTLQPELGGLRSLQHLDLSGNRFHGQVPESIAELRGLGYLNLSLNRLDGTFPGGLWRLQGLKVVDLRGNRLQGNVGLVLSDLRAAEFLDLSGNRFYGQLAVPARNLSGIAGKVRYLNLSHNVLAGRFFAADAMAQFRELMVLDVSCNELAGDLPGFYNQSNLRLFSARRNAFSGELPEGLFGASIPLMHLDLSLNNFTGAIMNITSTTLHFLNLSSNALVGPLPSSVGNCTMLDLSNNLLSGSLSVIRSWGATVEFLDLSSNKLSGNFSNFTSALEAIKYINIRNNSLQGALPSAIGSCCRNLSAIDLSLNRLEGSLPPSLFSLSNIKYLNFSGNLFTGNITFPKPYSFDRLASSTSLQMEFLDLSHNRLSGSLPPSIVALQKLLLLNLRNNSLSGKVPSEIGNLKALVFLDLAFNQLRGTVPEILLPNLTVFNVSYNNLSGIIPPGLRRFPADCFHPGNDLLVLSAAATMRPSVPPRPLLHPSPPASYYNYTVIANAEQTRARLAIRLAVVLGGIGVAVLVSFALMAVYWIRTQTVHEKKRGFQGGFLEETHGKDSKRGIFTPRLWSHKNSNGSISNNHLLQSSHGSACKERASNFMEGDFSGPQSAESGSAVISLGSVENSMLATFPCLPGQSAFDQPVVLGVSIPDQLPGELFFLDSSVIFTAGDLSSAPAEVLGRGCNGTSYKAVLKNGHMLTIKRLRIGIVRKKKEFAKEVKKIGAIKHPNIISLRAYLWGPTEQEKLIISDYVNGDSLAEHLHGSASSPSKYPRLSLSQRLNIAMDIARCLCFLHLDKGLPHGNLKPTNILLSGLHLTAQLADYGLHRIMTSSYAAEQMMNLVALGYGAPELTPAVSGTATKPVPSFKADIYAFGMIIMELLTGKRASDIVVSQSGAVDLFEWVQACARDGREAECYEKDIPGSEDSQGAMDAILAIGLRCILPVDERPSIKAVFDDLCSVTL